MIKNRRALVAIASMLVSSAMATTSVAAQPAYSVDSARAAVVAELRDRYHGATRVRLAPDSVTMWRDYVVCSPPGKPVGCEFRDSVRVQVVEVELRPPNDAAIHIKDYSTVRGLCPIFRPSAPPQIAKVGEWLFTFRLQNGRWVRVDEGIRAAC